MQFLVHTKFVYNLEVKEGTLACMRDVRRLVVEPPIYVLTVCIAQLSPRL